MCVTSKSQCSFGISPPPFLSDVALSVSTGQSRMLAHSLGQKFRSISEIQSVLVKDQSLMQTDLYPIRAGSSECINVSFVKEYPANGETQDRFGCMLVKSGHVHSDAQFFYVGCVLRDGWKKESLHWRSVGLISRCKCHRFQIVIDLKRSELSELLLRISQCLNVFEVKIWKKKIIRRSCVHEN